MRVRDLLPPGEQETLIPCPACEGTGKRITEHEGKYRQRKCRWCDGRGTVGKGVFILFDRWRRIKLANRLSGRCM